MKMVQGTNTNRVLTIAGSVALIALTTYGIWKWNQIGKVDLWKHTHM